LELSFLLDWSVTDPAIGFPPIGRSEVWNAGPSEDFILSAPKQVWIFIFVPFFYFSERDPLKNGMDSYFYFFFQFCSIVLFFRTGNPTP